MYIFSLQSPQESSQLHCYYSKTRITYFKAKAEEMNKDPKIFVFHDVIYEHEMAMLKREASKTVRRVSLAVILHLSFFFI